MNGKLRNEELLERIQAKRDILNIIVTRRVRMIEHNLRHPGMLVLISKRKIERKNWKGKQSMSYKKKITKDIECKFFSKIKRLAYKRKK